MRANGHTGPVPADIQLWSRVDKSGECWVWTGNRLPKGYGTLCVSNKHVQAHRLSWELANGPIPAGLWVLHHCDNPPCVRPDHLYVGTAAQNTADMIARGRWKKPPTPSGPTGPNLKLRKSHCLRGHPLTPDNRVQRSYGRRGECKTCHRDRMAGRLAA